MWRFRQHYKERSGWRMKQYNKKIAHICNFVLYNKEEIFSRLTKRQQEILQFKIDGYSNNEIKYSNDTIQNEWKQIKRIVEGVMLNFSEKDRIKVVASEQSLINDGIDLELVGAIGFVKKVGEGVLVEFTKGVTYMFNKNMLVKC